MEAAAVPEWSNLIKVSSAKPVKLLQKKARGDT